MHKLFCKRAGIEPTIGHLKSDYRLDRNFYKGVVGDSINILLAAAAYNFKRAMKVLEQVKKEFEMLLQNSISMKYIFNPKRSLEKSWFNYTESIVCTFRLYSYRRRTFICT